MFSYFLQSEVITTKQQPETDNRDELLEKGRRIQQLEEELTSTKSQLEKTAQEKSNYQKEAEQNMRLYQKEKIDREAYVDETDQIIEDLKKKGGKK